MKLGDIATALFFVGCAVFMNWRLWVTLKDRTASIRGGSYSRDSQPFAYWLEVGSMLSGAVMATGLAIVFI